MSLFEKYVFRDGCCTAEPIPENDKQLVIVRGPCYFCHQPQEVTVALEELSRFRAGEFAQRCFPTLPADKREFLLSGICGECWDKTFYEAEEDDAEDETEDAQ